MEEGQCAWNMREMDVKGDRSSVEDPSGLLKALGCCPHMLMILFPQTAS